MRNYKEVPEIAEIVANHQLYLKNKRKFRQYRAHFQGIDLSGVFFGNPIDVVMPLNLSFADFSGCDLSATEFLCVNLCDANFVNANIIGAKFRSCGFTYVPFEGPLPFLMHNVRRNINGTVCAPLDIQGELFGYKIISYERFDAIFLNDDEEVAYRLFKSKYLLAKLRIPTDSRRILFHDGKCRCEKAIVEDIIDAEGKHYNYGYSYLQRGPECIEYNVGQEVIADGWTENPVIECGHGIHFFLTEDEAWDYLNER